MPITAKQKQQRKPFIGSSDMAAIMGFDPFQNSYDVWLEKTDKLEPTKENKVMKRGHYLEPALLNFAEDTLGTLERNSAKLEFIKPEYYLISHPDAIMLDGDRIFPVEAKSQGNCSKELWGDENTDQVPDRVIIQCHVHLICAETKLCYIPAYLPYREFQMFHVIFDYDIAESIIEAAQHFWLQHVLKDIPPEDIVPNLAVIKRARKSKTVSDMPIELWEKFQLAKSIAKEAKINQDKAQAELLAEIERRKQSKETRVCQP